MVAIWEPQTRFRIWFEIEAHATDKLAELGVVPKEAAATIWAKAVRMPVPRSTWPLKGDYPSERSCTCMKTPAPTAWKRAQ